jgi:tetratricopeptide (TPR) repeat protein
LLDRRISVWLAAFRDSCEATNVRHEQSEELMDLRMRCLDDSLDSTRSLTELLARGDQKVAEHALQAIDSLEDVSRCADTRQLLNGPRPPKDPTIRKRVEELRSRLRESDSHFQVGDVLRSAEIARAVRVEAEALQYCPLEAEAMVLEEDGLSNEATVKLLERAIERAQSCGHDRVVARAATELVYQYALRAPALAERSAALARATIVRLGGDSRLEGWLANNMAAALEDQGRFAEAKLEAERAVKIKESTLGPDRFDTAISLGNLSSALAGLHEYQLALEYIERSIAIKKRWSGTQLYPMLTDYMNRAVLISRLRRDSEAEVELRRVLAQMEQTTGVPENSMGLGLTELGDVLVHLGRPREAIPYLERAIERVVRFEASYSPFDLAAAKFSLAKARDLANPRDRRAIELAESAAAMVATVTYFQDERAEIAEWLKKHHRVAPVSAASTATQSAE